MKTVIVENASQAEMDHAVLQSAIPTRFKQVIAKVLALISANPKIGAVVFRSMRYFVLQRFPYTIYYYEGASYIYVVAFIHHSYVDKVIGSGDCHE